MAAQAGIVPSIAHKMDFWDRFQCLTEQRVKEANFVAAERLWEIGKAAGAAQTLTIRSTIDPSNFLECSLDAEAGVLTCRQGSALKVDSLRFQLLGGTVDMLRREGRDCTLDQAITLILDELVWIDECLGESNDLEQIEGNDCLGQI